MITFFTFMLVVLSSMQLFGMEKLPLDKLDDQNKKTSIKKKIRLVRPYHGLSGDAQRHFNREVDHERMQNMRRRR